MITKLTTDELVKIGAHQRASYLLEQAGYTLGIAAAEGQPIAALLGPTLIQEVTQARDDVAAALQDKTNVAAESKHATTKQNQHVRDIKVWRRKIAKRVQRAVRQGAKAPDELTRIGRSQTVPALLEYATKSLALLKSAAADLDAVGPQTQPLIDEGQTLCDALRLSDSQQEQARTAELPASVRTFYARKAELYIGLKVINDAGHELHAHQPQLASRYNLSILHRHTPKTTAPSPAPNPAPTPVNPA